MRQNETKSRIIRLILGACATFGWWGLLYPELVIGPRTCKVIVCEESPDGDIRMVLTESAYNDALYRELMTTDPEGISFGSYFLDKWYHQTKK